MFALLELVPWLDVEGLLAGVEVEDEVESVVLELELRDGVVPRMFGSAMGRLRERLVCVKLECQLL